MEADLSRLQAHIVDNQLSAVDAAQLLQEYLKGNQVLDEMDQFVAARPVVSKKEEADFLEHWFQYNAEVDSGVRSSLKSASVPQDETKHHCETLRKLSNQLEEEDFDEDIDVADVDAAVAADRAGEEDITIPGIPSKPTMKKESIDSVSRSSGLTISLPGPGARVKPGRARAKKRDVVTTLVEAWDFQDSIVKEICKYMQHSAAQQWAELEKSKKWRSDVRGNHSATPLSVEEFSEVCVLASTPYEQSNVCSDLVHNTLAAFPNPIRADRFFG